MVPFARNLQNLSAEHQSAGYQADDRLSGQWKPLCRFGAGVIRTRAIRTGIVPVAAVMMLALGGCGSGTQKTVHLDGPGNTDPGNTANIDMVADSGGIEATGPSAEQPSGDQTGTILFMAAPEGGKPARLISRTDSITTTPTAKHLLQQALASGRQAPANTTSHTAPLVIEADDHQETPIQLPAPATATLATATPRTDSQITIRRQSQGAGQPTILKIMEAP
jgi:hypothetical protein